MLPPIVSAIQTVHVKNDELQQKITQGARSRRSSSAPPPGWWMLTAAACSRRAVANASTAATVDVGPLSMVLNGTIDAAVMGGTTKYVEGASARSLRCACGCVDMGHALKRSGVGAAFLGDDFAAANGSDPKAAVQQEELRESLRTQLRISGEGAFGRRASELERASGPNLVE